MKISTALMAAIALVLSAGQALAADATGVWATQADGGQIQVYRCGGGLCARILDAAQLRINPAETDRRNKDPALRGRPLKGLVVIEGFTGGPSEWTGSGIYDPKTGVVAQTGLMRLESANLLVVKGCVGPFCRTQRWTRIR